MINEAKGLVRQEILEKLKSIPSTEKSSKSAALSRNLILLLERLSLNNPLLTKNLVGFAPLRSEPIWFLDMEMEQKSHYKLFLPFILNDQEMEFKETSWEDLISGKIHWKSKSDGLSEKSLELFLVPGLAFTELGHRLGRGRGYYDRFFSKSKGIKIGIAFEDQILKTLPTENNDIVMDYIVTNQRYIICKGEK